jgi:hypothetical protein
VAGRSATENTARMNERCFWMVLMMSVVPVFGSHRTLQSAHTLFTGAVDPRLHGPAEAGQRRSDMLNRRSIIGWICVIVV